MTPFLCLTSWVTTTGLAPSITFCNPEYTKSSKESNCCRTNPFSLKYTPIMDHAATSYSSGVSSFWKPTWSPNSPSASSSTTAASAARLARSAQKYRLRTKDQSCGKELHLQGDRRIHFGAFLGGPDSPDRPPFPSPQTSTKNVRWLHESVLSARLSARDKFLLTSIADDFFVINEVLQNFRTWSCMEVGIEIRQHFLVIHQHNNASVFDQFLAAPHLQPHQVNPAAN